MDPNSSFDDLSGIIETDVECLALDEDVLSSIMFEVNEAVNQITDEIFCTA